MAEKEPASGNETRPPESAPAPEEDFATLLARSEVEASERRSVEVGAVVRGRVVAVGQTAAFVEIGGKGEAMIDLAEFRDPASGEVRIVAGDEIEATVVDDGVRSGSIVLKRSLGRGGHVPAELEQAMLHRIPVEAVVTAETKGGFEVQIGALRAFCPGSQIDLRRGNVRIPGSEYVGQRLRFHVTKIESGGRNVVVSRRALLEEEAAALAAATWDRLAVGAVVRGTVSSLRDFGAFVDLGGVEGLIHVSELGYRRVKHPSEVLNVGDSVEVQVTKIEPPTGDKPKKTLVGLSLRALAADPWTTVEERFPVGATVAGTVRRVETFGAFVELTPGVEGLAHVSKLTLDRRVSHARQVVNVGDAVTATILSVEPEKRRIGLSLVEQERQARDSAVAGERAETDAAVSAANERRTLGTLGDLLSRSPAARRRT